MTRSITIPTGFSLGGGGGGGTGPAGPGVPVGGTTGQILAKKTATDYDTQWIAPPSGGGGVTSVDGQTGVVDLSAKYVDVAGDTMTGPLAIGPGNVAASGYLRLPNNQTVSARNVGNTADVQLIKLDTTDAVMLGGMTAVVKATAVAIANNTAAAGQLRLSNGGSIAARNAANTGDINIAYVSGSDVVMIGSLSGMTNVGQSVSIGANYASSGQIKLANNAKVNWRNAANTADVNGIYVDATDVVVLGSSTNALAVPGPSIAFPTAAGTKIGTATTQKLAFWNAAPVAQPAGWSVTAGYTATKTFNPESTTLTEVARVLGTLIDQVVKATGLAGA